MVGGLETDNIVTWLKVGCQEDGTVILGAIKMVVDAFDNKGLNGRS